MPKKRKAKGYAKTVMSGSRKKAGTTRTKVKTVMSKARSY